MRQYYQCQLNLLALASHSPQDCGDKADGHLYVDGELAKMPVGIGMMGWIARHDCSLAELFLDARLDTVNDLPSLWTKASRITKEKGEQ